MRKSTDEELKQRKAARNKAYRQKHAAQLRAYIQGWREAHKEHIVEESKAYYHANKEAKYKKTRQWRKEHPKAQPVYARRCNQKLAEKHKITRKEYSARPEIVVRRKKYAKLYRETHREQIAQHALERRRRDPGYRLVCYLRKRLREALRRFQQTKKVSAIRNLGCTIPELIEYLTGKFTPGMSWDNYGMWHIDHTKPFAAFDLSDPAQQAAAVHYTNLRPLWGEENLRKGPRPISG